MSIKKETEIKNKITIKGILLSVGENEIEIEDEKTGDTDVLNINDDLGIFIGKSITLTITDSVKKDIEDTDTESVEE